MTRANFTSYFRGFWKRFMEERREFERARSRPYSDYACPDPKLHKSRIERPEYKYIIKYIEPESRVLDLGCV